jgi:predicted nucleic acid-binding protein
MTESVAPASEGSIADRAAVNASPLIVLANAGHGGLLRAVANQIIVPTLVADEIQRRGDDDSTVRFLLSAPWLEVIPSIAIPAEVSAWDLGPGESALLAWGLQNAEVELIIDDRQARHCAQTLTLKTRGTLSIVVRAKKIGMIVAVRPIVEDLRRAGIYISEPLINSVLRIVGEQE